MIHELSIPYNKEANAKFVFHLQNLCYEAVKCKQNQSIFPGNRHSFRELTGKAIMDLWELK